MTAIRTAVPTARPGERADCDDVALERATMRRVSLRLLPFLFLLYIFAYIDRANVGFAALQMNRDLRFSGAVYGFGAGIFFIGYGLFEVPSNLILARVGARRWIARIMVSWGALAAAMMIVRTPLSFYVLRFLLGVAEAGFFPGVVYYLGQWFPATMRARAVSRFMFAIPVAGTISGVLAGPLLGMQGRLGLAGWQWLFLLEGVPAALLGISVLFLLTDRPADARWLPEPEREWLIARLGRDAMHSAGNGHASFGRALRSARTWQLGYGWTAYYLCANAYSFWAPQLIRGLFGWTPGRVGGAMAAIAVTVGFAILLNGAHSDRRGERWLHVALPLLASAFAWMLVGAGVSPAVTLAALALSAITSSSIYGPFWSLPATFLAGEAVAGGVAFVSSLGAVGAAAGPNVLGVLPHLLGSQRAAFMFLAGVGLSASVVLLWARAQAARVAEWTSPGELPQGA